MIYIYFKSYQLSLIQCDVATNFIKDTPQITTVVEKQSVDQNQLKAE